MPTPGNIIHQSSTTTGTGNLTIASVNGRRDFTDEFATGGSDTFDYFIMHQSAAEWERGTGSIATGGVLVRDTVIQSSNSDNAVSFSAGTKDVTNAVPAASIARFEAAQTDHAVVRADGTAGLVQTSGVIIDDSNNVSGVGTLGAGAITTSDDLTFSNANPNIIGGDTNGVLAITADTATNQGGNIKLYGNTHATQAQDIEFYADASLVGDWDESAAEWTFAGNVEAGSFTDGGVAVPTISSSSTLTNKSIDLATNTLTGSTSEWDAAVQSDTFVFTSEAGTVFEAVDADILRADTGDTLTAGFSSDIDADGSVTGGTYTPAVGTGAENLKSISNAGAFTLGVPSTEGTIVVQMTNVTGAGAVTTSNYEAVSGDDLTTTAGDDFLLYITRVGATFAHLHVVALQ